MGRLSNASCFRVARSRDQEVVRTNFALKGEIDRLQSALEQSRREAAASKVGTGSGHALHRVP